MSRLIFENPIQRKFKVPGIVKYLYRFGLSFVYPEICQFCFKEKASKEVGYVGEQCRKQISPIQEPLCEICGNMFPGNFTGVESIRCSECNSVPPSFDWARAAVKTEGFPLEAIYKYKYGKKIWIEGWLGSLLVECAEKWIHFSEWDAIVPVPLHPNRQKKRGFNQAERLAKILSEHSGIALEKGLIVRVKDTPTQTRFLREDRLKNMGKAFMCVTSDHLSGKRFIVVDDVMTTGATCNAVAQVLKKQNASYVIALTVCRGTSLV